MGDEKTWQEDELEKFEVSEPQSEERLQPQGSQCIWRFVNAVMTSFFIMAAGVQFNDPDPYLWVPLYGVAALLTASVAFRPSLSESKKWCFLYWCHMVFCAGMFVFVVTELITAVNHPESDGGLNPLTYEEGRELAGLMITAVWVFICKQSPVISSSSTRKAEVKRHGLTTLLILFSISPLFLWGLCYSNILNSPYFSLCADFLLQYPHEEEMIR